MHYDIALTVGILQTYVLESDKKARFVAQKNIVTNTHPCKIFSSLLSGTNYEPL